jgi:hypothetical protein
MHDYLRVHQAFNFRGVISMLPDSLRFLPSPDAAVVVVDCATDV